MDEMDEMERPFEIRDTITNDYLYSYGGVSRFFREVVNNERIMGTRCTGCGKVWCPPRLYCSDCYSTTEWIPLADTGTVVGSIHIFYVPPNYSLHKYLDMPYVLALIQLDGADTCIYNTVYAKALKLNDITSGLRVKAVFREKREGKLTDFYFVPLNR